MIKGRVLWLLLFILYTSELLHIVGNHIVGYADDATIYAIISRPFSLSQVMEFLHQDMAANNSWCLKRHLKWNPKKTKSTAYSRSRTIAPGYGDLTVDSTEVEELKSIRILGVTLDF